MEKVVVSLVKYTFTPNDYLTGEASNAEVLLEKQAINLEKVLAISGTYRTVYPSDVSINDNSFFSSISQWDFDNRGRPAVEQIVYSLNIDEIDDFSPNSYQLNEIFKLLQKVPFYH